MGFDFENVDPFQASPDSVAPAGNYHFKVVEAEDTSASTGKPMIYLKLESAHGTQWDRLVISDAEFSRRKVAGLFSAAGVQIKNDMFTEDGHCKQAVLNKDILGKTVGGIVRDEDDNRPDHRGEARPKVQGYCEPARILTPGPLGGPVSNGGGDVPIDTRGLPAATGAQADIPF